MVPAMPYTKIEFSENKDKETTTGYPKDTSDKTKNNFTTINETIKEGNKVP